MTLTMDSVFAAGNLAALMGWVLLAAAPLARAWAPRLRWAAGLVIPALLAVAYAALIATRWGASPGGFGSIAQVRMLFADDGLLVAGWLHYLAFDLFVGGWIAREGARSGVPHWLLLPCFALTFLFGPAGLLLFLLFRTCAPHEQLKDAQP